MREYLEEILVVVAFIACAVGWYVGYVKPNAAHMAAVLTCVADKGVEFNETEWTKCHNALVPEAGALVKVFHPAVPETAIQ
jgi:beta-lactamase class D